MSRKGLLGCAAVLIGGLILWAASSARLGWDQASTSIQESMAVKIEYTLTVDGNFVESSRDETPFSYIHGKAQILPGLERQLAGLHVGDERELSVSPEEGYGPVDPKAFVSVPKARLGPDVVPIVGVVVRGTDEDGTPFSARISQVEEATVTLDFNHPLAGKTLLFQIKVLEISQAV